MKVYLAEKHAWIRKKHFHFSVDAALCCSKQALGASDWPLHQFTDTVEGLLLLSLSLSHALFSLSHFLLHVPSLSFHCHSLLFSLLRPEPLLTVMKRHVLCVSPSLTIMRDRQGDDRSRVGQERRGAREYGKSGNAPLREEIGEGVEMKKEGCLRQWVHQEFTGEWI